MKSEFENLDDFSLAVQLEMLTKLMDFSDRTGGGGKEKLKFTNSANKYIDLLAREFSDRKLDLGMCKEPFWLFPPQAQTRVLGYAAHSRSDPQELRQVFNALNRIAERGLEGDFSAIQTIKANQEKFEQFWTRPPDYLNKW